MTSVSLNTAWLSDAADPTDYLILHRLTSLTQTGETPGRLEETAGGRTRAIREEGDRETWTFTLPFFTLDEVDWIKDHRGRTVCARDDRGGKIFGLYLVTPFDLHKWDTGSGGTLALQKLTYSEAV